MPASLVSAAPVETAPGGGAAPIRRFGRYEVIRPLGRGAMGVVYLARDPQLERAVALKTVWWPERRGDDERLRAEVRARFLREARAAARFVHSSIVTVFDVGEEGDVTFIAMEYVAGRTLADLLAEEGPLPPARAAGLAASVADALAYAHAKGVVHRDVKPANLLVGGDGQVKVADFGIAKVADSTLTQEATVLGTPAYMAPEQISGRPIDARGDLFSLGVVLFEMLTGRRPFGGPDLTSLAYQVVHAPHPSLASLRAGLPPGFEAVCARALAKEPDARYQTGAEMAADLRALGQGRDPAAAAWAFVEALPALYQRVLVIAAAAVVAIWLGMRVLDDPVREARGLLAEGRRNEAMVILLKLEATDPDHVGARVVLLEHADSCALRRKVARRLGEIGDAAALPALEAARRRGFVDNICMGGTLDQAIGRIRGEEPTGGAQAAGSPAGQDAAGDAKRFFERIGEVFK